MEQTRKIDHAYVQKPWRRQLQQVGLFLAFLVFLVLIAGVNLRVNAEAATIGRQIQLARVTIEELENEIINQQALIAELTSASVLNQRALDLGFRQARSDEITYLVVEGYPGRSPAVLASDGKVFIQASAAQLPTEYTQTLWELLSDKFPFVKFLLGTNVP